MGDSYKRDFTVAINGTASSGIQLEPGYMLVALVVPTVDSTTIGFSLAVDGTTYVAVHTNTGATAAATLGNANTGGKVQAVPEELGRAMAYGTIRLDVASQTSLARTISGIFQKR